MTSGTEALTDRLIARATYSYARGDSLASLLQECAVEALNDCHVPRGWVDSHKLADAIFDVRRLMTTYTSCVHVNKFGAQTPYFTASTCDATQTRDYVQHCLREMFHGCRYNTDHCYQIHLDPQCSPQCRQHRTNFMAQLRKAMRAPLCPLCYVTLPITGQCDVCGNTP